MPYTPPAELPRCAVVDLGSNSVRLVVFEGRGRNPVAIFNEKAVLRLGRGQHASGRLNQDAVEQALTVMNRYAAIAGAMGARPFEVLATAAVRDAENGVEFITELRRRMPGVPIHVLAGAEEATFSAEGLLCGIPIADGLLADIGGGSLELIRLARGQPQFAKTFPLGVIRLAERCGGDLRAARAIAESELAGETWIQEAAGGDLYLVGGAWRALARIHIARTQYPLNMVHHYTISRDEARDLTRVITGASRRALERMPGVPRRRIEDLSFAAVVLWRVLRGCGARRVVFSANGLREGWYMRMMPPEERMRDPSLVAGYDYSRWFGRDPTFPPALMTWLDPLFPGETGEARRLREVACWMSDVGSHEHPEYRAEQAFLRILRQPGIGLDHPARAFLGLALALRYEAEPEAPFLAVTRLLLSSEAARQAIILGAAMRLAYTLSAGTPDLLAETRLAVNHVLTLRLAKGGGVFAGESITRRMERLGQAMGLATVTTVTA
jgi:exopolyphosphatase / guanosine-5'-triphosphate,3'-diphosphate pyrophosphatase